MRRVERGVGAVLIAWLIAVIAITLIGGSTALILQ